MGCDDGNTQLMLSFSKMNYTIRLSVADMITPVMINLHTTVLTEQGPKVHGSSGVTLSYLICEFLMEALKTL